MSAERLYTPQMLAAAVELANYPPMEDAPFAGSARSPACGSTLDMDLVLTADGKIDRIGMRVRACAVGQAAAAIFARHARSLSGDEIGVARHAFSAWLAGNGEQPDWPDVELIAAAREFPGRHGAMLLPWNAATAALSSAPEAG